MIEEKTREERFDEAVEKIVRQNNEIAKSAAEVLPFYQGRSDAPKREKLLEAVLDPMRNGAKVNLEELEDSLKEFARGEYPVEDMERLFDSCLWLVQDVLEQVHRGKGLHVLASLMSDFYRYLITPIPTRIEEHIKKIDEYFEKWIKYCCKNAAEFYDLTTVKIEERKRKKFNRKPRLLSYFSNANLSVLFRVHPNTISNWKLDKVATPPGFKEAIRSQSKDMIRSIAERYQAAHLGKGDAMNRKNLSRNLSEEEIYKYRRR